MDFRRNILALFIIFVLSNWTIAQSYQASFVYGASQILQHSKKATFSTPTHSDLLQLDFSIKTSGQKHWQRYWNKPTVGLNLVYIDFGNKEILGRSLGVIPSLGFDIFKKNGFILQSKLGLGLTYLNRHYNKIENPLNSAIGSHLNNITQLSISGSQRIYRQNYVTIGGHLTHISNAKTVTPNAGINLYGINLGILHQFNNRIDKEAAEKDSLTISRKWGADLLFGYGISEYSFTGGPKYGTFFINAGLMYKISPFIKIILGGDYEYSQSVFQFYYLDFDSKEVARQKATKIALYTAGELKFGIIGARFQTGFYLPYPEIRENTSAYYMKLNLNVYPFPRKWEVQPYFGVLLKSHAQVAQYLGLVMGVEI
jgi:hypothetical protein